MNVTFNTPESQATGILCQQLISAISQYQNSKYQDWYLTEDRSVTPSVILSRVDSLQEHFFDTYALLNKYPLEEHQFLWLYSINELMIRLLRLKSIYSTGKTDSRSASTSVPAPQGRPTMGRSSSSSSQVTVNLRNLDSNCREITAKLSKLSNDVVPLIKEFFGETLVISRLLRTGSTSVSSQLFSLAESSLKILTVDLDEDSNSSHYSFDHSIVTLKSLVRFVKRFYDILEDAPKHLALALHLGIFPILSECIKVAYHIDEPCVIIPLIQSKIISPTSPLKLVENCILDLDVLIDYYRYTSFAMLALSLETSQVNNDYNDLADVYFKILLKFPSLNLRLWNNLESAKSPIANFGFKLNSEGGIDDESSSLQPVLEDDDEDAVPPNSNIAGYNDITGIPSAAGKTSLSQETRYLSMEDRQEVSLLYLLNYLLKLKDFKSLICPANSFTNELHFLVTTLSTTISVDIHNSVSISSGSVSMSQLYQKEQERERKISTSSITSYSNGAGGISNSGLTLASTSVKCKSISSILFHGTYKEKLTTVINYFETLRKDKFSVSTLLSKYAYVENGKDMMAIESEFDRLVCNMESVRYPGKIKYVNAIRKVTSIIKATSILHWVRTTNIENIPEGILQRKFSLENLLQEDEILKNLVEVRKEHQGNVVNFPNIQHQGESGSIDNEITNQIEINELTLKMNALKEKLK
ncbi:hypothetical protein CLIB1423_01S11518 [[Candida] railenensis]|uniref:Uncharacterized protein n=1 Tax=[Candida] railenensis TaxID=45579 RepID=A0A9P0QKT9_9ASCO|nr:hypothetical protein CLIB1423_01S11518 [[Candida] railenensis]